jgi:hypothetical protein
MHLKHHLPGTSASNIYPALKNMAALLLALFSIPAALFITGVLGNIQSMFWGIFDR